MASSTKTGSSSTSQLPTTTTSSSAFPFGQLNFRHGSTFGGDQLCALSERLANLQAWKDKIAEIKELSHSDARGKLPLGYAPHEALRRVFLTTKLGKPEEHYKQLHEESMVYLDNYRRDNVKIERHYSTKETMEHSVTAPILHYSLPGFVNNGGEI